MAQKQGQKAKRLGTNHVNRQTILAELSNPKKSKTKDTAKRTKTYKTPKHVGVTITHILFKLEIAGLK